MSFLITACAKHRHSRKSLDSGYCVIVFTETFHMRLWGTNILYSFPNSLYNLAGKSLRRHVVKTTCGKKRDSKHIISYPVSYLVTIFF